MGNCLRHQSSTRWGGDDWGILTSEANDNDGDDGFFEYKDMDMMNIEEKGLLENDQKFDLVSSSSSSSVTHEVKVKITKKQLEELLGRFDVKELSVEQVLEQLINVSNQYDATNQRSWRPALQSIPEVN